MEMVVVEYAASRSDVCRIQVADSAATEFTWGDVVSQQDDESLLLGLSKDMQDYIRDEANRRSVSVRQVYEEEETARVECEELKPSFKHLMKLARNPKRPAKYWKHGDEDCPF